MVLLNVALLRSFTFLHASQTTLRNVFQIPIFEPRSDGRENLLNSLIIAGNFIIPEVSLHCGRSFHRFLNGVGLCPDGRPWPCTCWLVGNLQKSIVPSQHHLDYKACARLRDVIAGRYPKKLASPDANFRSDFSVVSVRACSFPLAIFALTAHAQGHDS